MPHYKVVSKDLKSGMCKDFAIQYKEGEWVEPVIPNSLLMVFANFDMANAYTARNKGMMCFECDVLESRGIRYVVSLTKSDEIPKFWEDPKNFTGQSALSPPFTFGCKAVKLTKRVI